MSSLRNLLVAASVSLVYLNLAPAAMAKDAKGAKVEPNCEVKNGKKVHLKDKAACEKKKGKWLETDASVSGVSGVSTPSTTTTPVAVPPPSTPAAQPSGTEQK